MAFDVNKIRSCFPILHTEICGHPLIYLDNAATTQMPECVLETIAEQHHLYQANVHRGIHTLSERSTERMEDARHKIKNFLNARADEEIIFTSGTTAAVNLAARSFGEAFLRPGDEVLVTVMEHHSNFVPWQQAAKRQGAVFRVLPLDTSGNLRMDLLPDYLNERTKLVAVCAVSNVLGTVNPLKKMIRAAHAVGAKVFVDAAQGIRHGRMDVQKLGCDFLAFSGHKIMGPTGTGILYGRQELLDQMPPTEFGGGMVGTVTETDTAFEALPQKFEAGTPNIVGSIALGVAIEYYSAFSSEATVYETELLAYAEQQLRALPEVQIMGAPRERAAVISFQLNGWHPYDTAVLLDKLGIAVRSGHHCAQPLFTFYGRKGAVRVSPAFYNTREEVDALVAGLKRIICLTEGRML